MQISSILELVPSALGLFVVAVLVSFVLLLVTSRLHRVIFGARRGGEETSKLRDFLHNFD